MIRDAYREVENVAKNELLEGLPPKLQTSYNSVLMESEEEKELWRYVKAADKISAWIKCIEEKRTGNTDFVQAEKTIAETVHAMKLPEAEYFVEQFLPAFASTLDEST